MKLIVKTLLTLLCAAAMFSFGFVGHDVFSGKPLDTAGLASLVKPPVKSQSPNEVFTEHYGHILAASLRQAKADDLKYAAMTGAVASLGDPHTNFLEPRINEAFTLDVKGDFVGIGARLTDDPLGAKIVSVFKGGPAEKAGLMAEDVVSTVNGKEVAGTEVDKIVSQIRGEPGTTVQIGVVRPGKSGLVSVTAVRQKVNIPTAEGKIIDGDIGYIQVSGFSAVTASQFADAMNEIDAKRPKGLILDFRGNPGGLLNAAIDMLSLFVSDKVVVTVKYGNGKTEAGTTPSGKAMNLGYPVTILVNEESASASEIFTGAMKDYGKATVIGTHTYGKASVQDLHQLPESASLKVTIARYFLPSTPDISRKVDEDGAYVSGGIKPDIEEAFKFAPGSRIGVPGKDNQLDRAIRFLRTSGPVN